ncbi:alpha/beta fold hydrolase [Streptomyces sp. SudanB182_2057]|uniref:alpha/beta fold hydrolase n=1 Tax=Streptomyces sp. SudanB182_2057 TaxID=3035281 RepID=UPI003F551983
MKTSTAAYERAVEEHWTDVAGTRTRYLAAGRGSPVLLLHGEGGVSEEWDRVLGGLAGSHRVIAVDMPGYGYTEPISDASPAAMAAFAWKFAHRVHAERPAVMGHSLGGSIAVHMALQRPTHIPALVLISSSGMGHAVNPAMVVQSVTPLGDLTRWLVPVLPCGPRLLVASMAVIGSVRPWRMSPRWTSSQVKALSSPEALRTTLRSQRASVGLLGQKELLVRRLPELPMPILVAWGTHDRMLPFWQAIGARRRLSRGQLKLIPCTGHMVPQESAGPLLGAVRPFLARNSRGAERSGDSDE